MNDPSLEWGIKETSIVGDEEQVYCSMLLTGNPSAEAKDSSNYCCMCAWECHVLGNNNLRVRSCYIKRVKTEQIYEAYKKSRVYKSVSL